MTQAPTTTEMFRQLESAPAPPTTDTEKQQAKMASLPKEEKWRQAWGWKMQGVPISAIAKMFDVDVRTINRWIGNLKAQFRESFEGETAADCLAGHLMKLESLEEACRYEANQLSKEGKQFDPVTGKVIESKNVHQQKGNQAKFLKIALDAEMAQVKVLQEVGVLPTKEPERMYKTMEDEGKLKSTGDTQQVSRKRDRNETIGELIDALQSARTL